MLDTGNALLEQRTPIPRPERTLKQSSPITEIFAQMINDFEATRPHNINIMNVAGRYNIQHRRAYDLFNLLTSLKVCRSVERGRIAWNSLADAVKTVANEYIKLETESLTKSTRELFDMGPSPSLGIIATRFMSLFIYLGVDKITLRQALPLFRNEKCDVKSLERRLYLVLGMLELMNLLTHSKRTGEYGIVPSVTSIRERAMRKKHAVAMKTNPECLEATLSKLGEPYINRLLELRREDYQELSKCI